MGVKSLRMVSPREVWALFQASNAFTVIEFFPYKLVHKDGLNSLQVADEVVSWLSRAKSEPIVEDWWQETIDKFTDQKHIFKKELISEFK